jgi:hypothetical protein
MEYTRTLTPSLSHSMGEGARRAGEGRFVVYPGHSVVFIPDPAAVMGHALAGPQLEVRCSRRETCYASSVKTITIRDLRQRWPEAEAALQSEREILITRDAKPVAMLVRVPEKLSNRKRWDPDKHGRRIKVILGGKTFLSVDDRLAEARADRTL